MYFGNGYSASARHRYAAVDTGSRIEGANPHQLVKVLFDELLLSIDAAILSEKAGDRAKCTDRQARALSILHALESSLDFDRGGQLAVGLAQIYREARRLIVAGLQSRSVDDMHEARNMINEIAEAWTAIG
ncbi:flagellar export chaperone FliS [Rhizorhapis sp. SPR117]|uniref:flagellar export chaperone FliS n=1 Tax=Rhizorhapis sp. SPR117 TaxID=2912611 RepID=UPI001F1AC6A6|nr:flagellar protein FliS [Rhizorhapis sp. SPR117]